MSFFSDAFHLFVRSMKKLVRNPILVFFSLFQPIIFLLLFTQLFSGLGRFLGGGILSYTAFATAGIVLQNAFSSAFQSGTAVAVTFPLLFMSTALVTAGFMPTWMQDVSTYNPVSIAVNAIRNPITGCNVAQRICNIGFDWNTILQAYGVIAAIGLVTLGATLYLFRKVVS